MKQLSICLLIALILPGCATMGGKEISDAEINGEAAKAYAEVKSKSKISTNAEWSAMVQRVAQRIARASGENFQWEAVLIENPEPNAWCMPGGKIAVFTGIVPILKTEGALAAVMGHEVAHATRRHGKKAYSRAITQNTVGLIVGGAAILGGQMLCQTSKCKLLAGLGGAAAGFGIAFFERKFSREDETEADKIGQIYMAKAGYEVLRNRFVYGSAWARRTAEKRHLNLCLPIPQKDAAKQISQIGCRRQILTIISLPRNMD